MKIMTPEEKFDRHLWYVLKKIKDQILRTKNGDPLRYWIYFNVIGSSDFVPSSNDEAALLNKLDEWGAVKILNPGGTGEYE